MNHNNFLICLVTCSLCQWLNKFCEICFKSGGTECESYKNSQIHRNTSLEQVPPLISLIPSYLNAKTMLRSTQIPKKRKLLMLVPRFHHNVFLYPSHQNSFSRHLSLYLPRLERASRLSIGNVDQSVSRLTKRLHSSRSNVF